MTYTEKYLTNEYNNIIRVSSTSIILLIFMSDIFFLYMSNGGGGGGGGGGDVLLSTVVYDLWVKYHEYLLKECKKDVKKHRQQ